MFGDSVCSELTEEFINDVNYIYQLELDIKNNKNFFQVSNKFDNLIVPHVSNILSKTGDYISCCFGLNSKLKRYNDKLRDVFKTQLYEVLKKRWTEILETQFLGISSSIKFTKERLRELSKNLKKIDAISVDFQRVEPGIHIADSTCPSQQFAQNLKVLD